MPEQRVSSCDELFFLKESWRWTNLISTNNCIIIPVNRLTSVCVYPDSPSFPLGNVLQTHVQ